MTGTKLKLTIDLDYPKDNVSDQDLINIVNLVACNSRLINSLLEHRTNIRLELAND